MIPMLKDLWMVRSDIIVPQAMSAYWSSHTTDRLLKKYKSALLVDYQMFEESGYNPVEYLNYELNEFWELYSENIIHEYETTQQKYEMLENYNRIENGTLKKTGSDIHANSGDDITTKKGSDTITKNGSEISTKDYSGKEKNTITKNGDEVTTFDTSNTVTDTQIKENISESERVSANEYSSYTPSEKTTNTDAVKDGNVDTKKTGTETVGFNNFEENQEKIYENRIDTDTLNFNNRNDTTEYDTTDTLTHGLNTKITYDTNDTTESTIHGNIGVTTSQQMIQSERELWYWSFTDWLVDFFMTKIFWIF